MFKKKQNAKPKEITYERVKGYYLWLIGKYGDYTAKTLKQKALRHLIGQGFSYSVANKAISHSGNEDL